MNFNQLYADIEFDLGQTSDSYDGLSSNSSKPLPKNQAKRIINECIVKILKQSHSVNDTEILSHTFSHDTTILEIDNAIYIYAIKDTNGQWKDISDPYSKRYNNLRMVNSSTIENPRGWKSGDNIEIQVVLMPYEIVNDDDPVDWENRDIELLRKTVVIEVATIVGVKLNQFYIQDRERLMVTFKENNRLNHVTRMHKMRGANLGRIGG